MRISPIEQARAELEAERFRNAVEVEKQRLRNKQPWWVKLFPYVIKIERRK